MPGESSNSVRVFFADKSQVLGQIRGWAERLKARDPEVERVGLFGSYATGTYGPASDADLLIVLRRSSKPFRDRIPDYLPDTVSVCCDVFPYTVDEMERGRAGGSPWFRHVLNEVVWL